MLFNNDVQRLKNGQKPAILNQWKNNAWKQCSSLSISGLGWGVGNRCEKKLNMRPIL